MIDNNENIMYFDTDNDFYEFCVLPKLVPIQYTNIDGDIAYYTDFNFTNAYQDAIKNGIKFVIKDEDSQIQKHGSVTYRTITKPIENLCQYFGDL